jgi:hypothetical protein
MRTDVGECALLRHFCLNAVVAVMIVAVVRERRWQTPTRPGSLWEGPKADYYAVDRSSGDWY